MKKAKFIVLVLGVILAFAMFAVACDDKPLPDDSTPPETETYTVTFVNGETTVKEAEVQKGNALTAENMPGNPTTDADEEFDGWFSGETEIKVGYIPTADVTASAVFTQQESRVQGWRGGRKNGLRPSRRRIKRGAASRGTRHGRIFLQRLV